LRTSVSGLVNVPNSLQIRLHAATSHCTERSSPWYQRWVNSLGNSVGLKPSSIGYTITPFVMTVKEHRIRNSHLYNLLAVVTAVHTIG